MAAGATTGTYAFGSSYASDIVLEVYERLGWRPASLTAEMMASAQRSFNYVQSRWSNLGVNLWEASLYSFILTPGLASYTLPQNIISILPAPYLNTLALSTSTSITPPFTTVSGSNSITVTQLNNGLAVGDLINIATPVSIGGIVLYGYYTVATVAINGMYTFLAANAATSSSSSSAIASFTTDGTTANVVVYLSGHTFAPGSVFNVQVPVVVGGVTLSGQYTIGTTTASSFTLLGTAVTTSATTTVMNNAKVLIQTPGQNQDPISRVLYPLSRPDYNSIAAKDTQAPPSSFWFDKTTTPNITFWPTPDSYGPYQFNYYGLSQIQDASIGGGAILDIPFRFLEAYAAAVAAHLAMKWRPDIAPALMQYATQTWTEASDADREIVSFYIGPDLSGYYG